jgi:hypothetical protein
VRCSILQMAIGPTWQVMQSGGVNDSQLLDLQRAWQSMEILPPFIGALEMERALTIEEFAAMRQSVAFLDQALHGTAGTGGGTSVESFDDLKNQVMAKTSAAASRHLLMPAWQFSFSHEDERRFLERSQTVLNAARACLKQRSAAAFQQINLPAKEPAGSGLAHIRDLLAWSYNSSLIRAVERSLSAETQRQLVIAAIGIHRYTLQHGHPPTSLESLVPQWLEALPQDYWSGKALLYQTNTSGAPLLYSVGPDGRDNGGDPPEDKGRVIPIPLLFRGRDMVWPVAIPESALAEALKVLRCNSVATEPPPSPRRSRRAGAPP